MCKDVHRKTVRTKTQNNVSVKQYAMSIQLNILYSLILIYIYIYGYAKMPKLYINWTKQVYRTMYVVLSLLSEKTKKTIHTHSQHGCRK